MISLFIYKDIVVLLFPRKTGNKVSSLQISGMEGTSLHQIRKDVSSFHEIRRDVTSLQISSLLHGIGYSNVPISSEGLDSLQMAWSGLIFCITRNFKNGNLK